MTDLTTGAVLTWRYRRGDVLAGALSILALIGALAIGSGPYWLGAVLLIGVAGALTRVYVGYVRLAAETRAWAAELADAYHMDPTGPGATDLDALIAEYEQAEADRASDTAEL